MRLFIAVQFSDAMKKSLIGMMHELKTAGIKGNFTPVDNLHLTMCFIGETKERAKIEAALSQIEYKPFKLCFTETGNFGDLFWIGAKSGQAMNKLAADIRKALDSVDVPYDTKKFKPHITLVRKMAGKAPALTIPKADMMVKKVSLMKSERQDGRMVYTELFAF